MLRIFKWPPNKPFGLASISHKILAWFTVLKSLNCLCLIIDRFTLYLNLTFELIWFKICEESTVSSFSDGKASTFLKSVLKGCIKPWLLYATISKHSPLTRSNIPSTSPWATGTVKPTASKPIPWMQRVQFAPQHILHPMRHTTSNMRHKTTQIDPGSICIVKPSLHHTNETLAFYLLRYTVSSM